MTRIAYIVSNPCVTDARVIKIARAAVSAGHEVHVFATLGPGTSAYEHVDGITFHRLEWRPADLMRSKSTLLALLHKVNKRIAGAVVKRLTPFIKYRLFSTVFARHVALVQPDIIHAHDLICLPTAYDAAQANGAKLVYDAHELEVHRNPPLPFLQKKFVSYVEEKYGRRADAVITVGRMVGEVLGEHLKRNDINVIYNSPIIEACDRNIRTDLALDPKTPVLLYVGKVTAGRGVGDIVSILPKLNGVHFATVGPCDEKTRSMLERQAERLEVGNRFRILPPVPFEQVVEYIRGADIGIISVEPVTLSYQYCMPNKLFEMAFANVPIISNELDEIREFLSEHGNGKIAAFEDKAALAYVISRVLADKSALTLEADRFRALELKYSWDAQKTKLSTIYSRILKNAMCAVDGGHELPKEKPVVHSYLEPAVKPPGVSESLPNVRAMAKGDIQCSLLVEQGTVRLYGNVAERSKSDAHRIVYLDTAPVPDEVRNSRIVRIFFNIRGLGAHATPFTLLISAANDEITQKVRINVDADRSKIVFDLDVPVSAPRIRIGFYQDRAQRTSFEVDTIGLICNSGIYLLTQSRWDKLSNRIERSWEQQGDKCLLKTTLGDFYAVMPAGWKLSEVPDHSLKVAEHFLLGPIESSLFGINLYEILDEALEKRHSVNEEAKDMLAFSAGEDSTAAALLLPDETIKYFCKRDYTSYKTPQGFLISLQEFGPLNAALEHSKNVIVIPNNFEQIGLAAGFRSGFTHNFGYASIGALLAKHINARSVAFGSVMEQVFMGSGNNYIDVAKIKSSRVNQMSKVLAYAGLDLCLPTSACSEVLTNRIARKSHLKEFVISCASADAMGKPCGMCFKCFRKLRLEGNTAPEPSEAVKYLLSKYPLKSATSVMYAVQRSGYTSEATDRYKHLQLDFLERYHGYAINTFVPKYLRSHVEAKFSEFGILPMAPEDEAKLRSIGLHFWPEKFDPKRAGIEV